MANISLIQCFAIALLTQNYLALPTIERRSGIFGMGDTGGQNRDESLNQIINVIGDSFMSGENNNFSPKSATGGIDGLGTSRVRRSGVLGLGDTGGQNRDESLNQVISVIGDSFMDGKGNTFAAESVTGGISGISAFNSRVRRSGVFGLGDTGGQNRDDSLNQAINIIGDSFMVGKNNAFEPESSTGGIAGIATSRNFRRSGIFGMGDTGGQNRDESLNQIINVIGDSFMSGENNNFSPKSATGGIDGLGTSRVRRSGIFGMGDSGGQNTDESSNQIINVVGDSLMSGENNIFSPTSTTGGIDGLGTSRVRRSGIFGMGDTGGQNTDQSTNQSVSTIGDDLMGGSNNSFNPSNLVSGISGISGLARRGGFLGLGESASTNNDASTNQNLLIKGDSILTGQSNSFVPALDVGGISGVGSSHVRRGGIFGLGDTGSSNSDSSDNQNLAVFGDSILSGKNNVFGPSASIKGIDGVGTSHVRRGGFLGLGESGSTNNDASTNQNLLVKGDSILTGENNSFVPTLEIGGISGVGSSHVRRSGIFGLGNTGSSNSDSSDNQNLAVFGDSILSGKNNVFGPSASIKGIDGVGKSVVN